jgi:membrane-bound ClpP family serine protease
MVNVREEIDKMEAEGSAETKGFMDIRFFIGLILIIYGAVLIVYGLLQPGLAAISLNINLNFWWGLVILIIGLAFFIPSKKPSQWGK